VSGVRLRQVAEPLLAFVAAAAYFLAFVPYGFYLEDEGTVLYQIARTYHGQLPYIDFHTGYTPILFYGNVLLFRLFGVNVIALRVVLALVNAASSMLVFTLTRRVASLGWAIAGMLAYTAFLPFFGGEFASFNIPYPSWYTTLFWLAGTAFLLRYEESGRRLPLVLAGVAAGVCFGFKPNGGAFAAAAAGLAILVLATPTGGAGRRRLAGFALGAFGIAIAVLFGLTPLSFEMAVFVLPWLALAVVAFRHPLVVDGPIGRKPFLDVVLFGVGFLLPTLPWLAFLATRMSVPQFMHEVLLVGGGVQQVYWIPYPLPEWWALALCVAVVAGGGAALALRAGRVTSRTVALAAAVIGVVAGGTLAFFARMPEGLALSVIWQLENAGFYLVPLALGTAVWWLARVWQWPAPELRPVVVLVISGLAMLEQMNPRMDFMHLVMAVPASVPVIAFLGARLARAWRRVGPAGSAIATVLLAVPLAVATVRLGANLGRILQMDRVDRAVVPGERAMLAGVGVEATVGQDLASLRRVVGFVETHTKPTDPLFGFPAMAAVNFLSRRDSPVRHDYFFPGRPAHTEEAEVVQTLAAAPPPYIVTLNDRFGFFQEAPAYYLVLRDFIRRHYVLGFRTGRYDVLRRRDLPAVPDRGEPEPERPSLAAAQNAAIGGPLRDRLAAVDELGRRGGPDDVPVLLGALHEVHRTLRARVTTAVLAVADRHGGLRELMARVAPPERDELLLMRSLGEFADVRALDYLTVRFANPPSGRIRGEAGRALAFTTARLLAAPYVFANDRDGAPPALSVSVPAKTLEGWLHDRYYRRRIGPYASVALALSNQQDAVPLIHSMLREKRLGWLRVSAVRALAYLRAPTVPCDLVGLMGADDQVVQDHVPSLFLEVARWAPEQSRGCLVRGLTHGNPQARETAAWTAGVWRDHTLVEPLVALAGRHGDAAEVAALWALGEIGDARAADAIAAALASGDPTVRDFAREAQRKLGTAAVARG